MFDLSDKVLKYETFLNERLKTDLRKLYDERDLLCKLQSEYLLLKNQIEIIKDNKMTSLTTSIDLGCNCYCQAKIDDTSKIFVLIGLGFFAELTHDEAIKFIEKKLVHLETLNTKLTNDISKVKAHIRLVTEGLREIQEIS